MDVPPSFAQSDFLDGIRFFFEQAVDRPWVTLVELLLIGGVVYAILRSLEGTRGARLVRAVFTILGVSFAVVWLVAERFEFERINALYPYFILGVFLVSLVAFQVEVRRLLLRLGEGGWLGHWLGESEGVIVPIMTAVESLARKKIGALIAIERRTEAGAIAESGVQLDAAVTAELLETIFWPGSALHDLGVLISRNRLRAAGCQFPLADSGDVDRSLGSRHRAAVGMSLETDAVVVVVSEETGAISVAVRGRLHRSLSSDAFRAILAEQLDLDLQTVEAAQRNAAPPTSNREDKSSTGLSVTGQTPVTDAGHKLEHQQREGDKDGAGQAA